ncbi:MAG: DMT family transporter [Pseudomonadota bacterium]
MFLRTAPFLFVLIWSTGWITAGAATQVADPLAFLTGRFVIAAVCLAVFMAVSGVSFPRSRNMWQHGIVSGILLHAIYLMGVWVSINNGLPASIAGIVAALQPLLAAILAVTYLHESLSRLQWFGLVLGFVGLATALGPSLFGLTGGALANNAWLIGLNVMAITSVTVGSLYQKRFLANGDLRAITLMQYCGAGLVILPLALVTGSTHIELSLDAALVMAWAVFALSFGAVGLYLFLLRNGAVSKVSSFIYLIPPLVAVEAFFLFDEGLSLITILGMTVTVLGVYLVNRNEIQEKDKAA